MRHVSFMRRSGQMNPAKQEKTQHGKAGNVSCPIPYPIQDFHQVLSINM
jgi:hypothetical protein